MASQEKKYKLSILVPSIRPSNILCLYESIKNSLSDKFELIVVGPYSPPIVEDIKWFKSYRSPNAAQQQALLFATGEYISPAADDGIFLPGMLDKAVLLASEDTVVVGKYIEGDNPINMDSEEYYKFGYHKAYRLRGVPKDGLIFNCGIISRNLIIHLGGYDANNFNCTTLGHADLSIRLGQSGANMILMNHPLFRCSHQPGKSGDHAPIDKAMKQDLKNFKKLYSKPRQTNIDLDNWKNTQEVWKRFK